MRNSPHHGQIVHAAADRQPPDIASGEEEGRDDMPVGRDGQAPTVRQFQTGCVVAARQCRIVEGQEKHLADQIVRQAPTASMTQDDPILVS